MLPNTLLQQWAMPDPNATVVPPSTPYPGSRAAVAATANEATRQRLRMVMPALASLADESNGTPAATANAVAGANAARTDTSAGGSIGSGPGVTPSGLSPTTSTDLSGIGPGITKIQGVGGRTVYTDKGQAGYDEIRDMRAPLPSIPSALRNVPEMMSVINPQRGNAANGLASPSVSSVGGAPTFIPGDGSTGPTILGRGSDPIADMDAQISKYMRPGSSIFDQWRGRQLEKRRDRMMMQSSLATNALANMTNAQTAQQRAGDTLTAAKLNADAHRYSADKTAAAHALTAQVDLAKSAGTIKINELIQRALQAKDWGTAQKLATLAHPQLPYGNLQSLALEGMPGFMAQPNKEGGVNLVNIKEMAAAQAAQAQQQQLEAEAQRRAAGGK